MHTDQKVTNLKLVDSKANAGLVKQLKHAVELAERGELVEVQLIARATGGRIYACFGGKNDSPFEMYGALVDNAARYRDEHIKHLM